jgi:hypothetical protein
MVELSFDCVGGAAAPYAAVPTFTLALRISETTGTQVHAIALRCQIRIEPARRRYGPREAAALHDLFGDPARWAETLKPIQLAQITAMVPGFTGSTEVELAVPCTYDLEVGSATYLRGLRGGDVPLLLLFSGTVFAATPTGYQVHQVPWSKEASYRLPVAVWQEVVDRYFPHSAWVRMDLDTLDALRRYKSRAALPTWDATLLALLAAAGEPLGDGEPLQEGVS